MNNLKKSSMMTLTILCILMITTSAVFATTKIVYNGSESSGWAEADDSEFHVASYGYDGTMYWTDDDEYASAAWSFFKERSDVDYYVYIPRHNATADARYRCVRSLSSSTNIYVDQSEYYDEWIHLGEWDTEAESYISLLNSDSGRTGFDEVKFVY